MILTFLMGLSFSSFATLLNCGGCVSCDYSSGSCSDCQGNSGTLNGNGDCNCMANPGSSGGEILINGVLFKEVGKLSIESRDDFINRAPASIGVKQVVEEDKDEEDQPRINKNMIKKSR